jgi:glutaredoxin
MTFIVYSKSGCPFCTKVQRVLELSEQKYVVYKLNEDYTGTEFYDKFGVGSTFPQVIMNVEGPDDGTHLGGCTETVSYLRKNNLV